MRVIGLVLVLGLCAGCMSTGGKATLVKADGTAYTVEQRNVAVAGGKAKAADQQFVATYKTPEGTEITVKMGNGVEQPSSPNTIQDVTGLVGAIGALVPAPGGAPAPEASQE